MWDHPEPRRISPNLKCCGVLPYLSMAYKKYTKRRSPRTGNLKKVIRKVIKSQAERKVRSSSYEEVPLNTLTQTSQGLTPFRIRGGSKEDERVGNEVTARGISMRGHFYNNSTTVPTMVRCLVLSDKRGQGDAFTGDNLLMKNNAPVTYIQGTESMYLPINRARYQVAYDHTWMLSANTPDNMGQYKKFQKFIKISSKVKFSDENDSSIQQGDWKVIFWSAETSNDVGLGNIVELYVGVSGLYVDM